MDISDINISAGAMEGRACADKELEKPSDLRCSSTEQEGKHELSGLSGEDYELDPIVGTTEPPTHIEMTHTTAGSRLREH
jgi:hypothetical protein